jgi:hypothetical protein
MRSPTSRSEESQLRRQLPFILAGVVLMTLQPILVTLSQDERGQFQYSTISSTLLTGERAIGSAAPRDARDCQTSPVSDAAHCAGTPAPF